MGTPYSCDHYHCDGGMRYQSTRIELFYFDDNFRRIAQSVLAYRPIRAMVCTCIDLDPAFLIHACGIQCTPYIVATFIVATFIVAIRI